MRLAIPTLALLVALFLYFRRPPMYVAYTLWVWFLTPLVRRLVDWKFGWQEQSLILLSPHLVASVALLSILIPSRKNSSRIPPAFVLCAAGVLYGFVIGIFVHRSMEVAYGLLNWMAPLLFGAHLAINWKHYERNRDILLKCFVWGAGVMGLYGIYQFFFAPPWDTFWLQNVSSGLIDPSFGQPEPMLIRVWSTLNAPGAFAGVMTTALLLLTVASSSLKIPFAIAGYLAFLLTAVRAAWLGWIVGLVLMLRKARPKLLVRILGSMVLVALCVIPIVENPQLAPMIGDRLKTLTDLKQDGSFRERQDMYRVVTGVILHEPFGHGLRNQEIVHNLAVDSGILTTLLSLGWLGTLLYIGGVAVFIFQSGKAESANPFTNACRAVCFASLAQYVGGNIFVNVGGAVFWICAGGALAGNQWQLAKASHFQAETKPEDHWTQVVPPISTVSTFRQSVPSVSD
jgi:hypothetical protein